MDNKIDIFDSNEERLVYDWLFFLKEKGYIIDFNKNIFDIIEITSKIEKCNKKCVSLLRPWTYTYDFKIEWNLTAHNLFYNSVSENGKGYFITNNNISYIDVKGNYTRRNRVTDITFPLVQKAVYHIHNIYIQKIVPIKLFLKLFATDDYLINDNAYKVGTNKGNNKFELKSFDQFINGFKQK